MRIWEKGLLGGDEALLKLESLARYGRYKKRVSLGRAAEMAGVRVGDMIEILASYGIKSNLDQEDYRQGLENLRKVW